MIVGYCRTSTIDQVAGLEAQQDALSRLGCERTFVEQTSALGPRKAFDEAMAFVREGDTFVVTELSRLARSVADLVKITEALARKGVALRVVNLGLDTTTPTGKLILNVMGCVAEFERQMMLERQKVGIANAKADKRYKGRAPVARRKAADIKAMADQGTSKREIAKRLGVGERSVYRILAASPGN